MQNQNAQIVKLVEFLKQNPGHNVVFKKFVNDFLSSIIMFNLNMLNMLLFMKMIMMNLTFWPVI